MITSNLFESYLYKNILYLLFYNKYKSKGTGTHCKYYKQISNILQVDNIKDYCWNENFYII